MFTDDIILILVGIDSYLGHNFKTVSTNITVYIKEGLGLYPGSIYDSVHLFYCLIFGETRLFS